MGENAYTLGYADVPFDVGELRANIGDDADLERLLLGSFLESAGKSLAIIQAQFPSVTDAGFDALWKTHMHQIKGAALNLGAHQLTAAALNAQQGYQLSVSEKKNLLRLVLREFESVRHYIDSLLA